MISQPVRFGYGVAGASCSHGFGRELEAPATFLCFPWPIWNKTLIGPPDRVLFSSG